MDYGSLVGAPPVGGQRLTQLAGTTAGDAVVSVDQDVLVDPGQAIYWSALFTPDDSANGNHRASIAFRDDTNGDAITFGEPAVGGRGLRIEAATVATGQLVTDGVDNAFLDGQTLRLVGRSSNAAAPGGDRLDLLVYDTADAEPLAPIFDPADSAAEHAFALAGLDIDFAAIRSLVFTIRGADNNFVDELRIGSTYASVVPEPSMAALLLVAFAALAARGRHPTAPR